MSEPCGSISGSPFVIHSATVLAIPGASLIQIAAADQRFFTSGVSPMIGLPSGVSDSRPLIASFTPDRLVADDLGEELERVLELGVEVLLGERQHRRREGGRGDRRDVVGVHEDRPVGVRADLEAGPVLALVHVRVHVADDREADVAGRVLEQLGTGPMSIIWWTAGVSGIDAPAIFAIRGLQTPQAMTTTSASIVPPSVWTRRTWPSSTSMPVTSTPAATVRAPSSWAFWRISVPAWSESTTPTPGV